MNKLIIAAAGSGKTTYLVKCALEQCHNVLITTFTKANEEEIRKKFIEIKGYVPKNITIQSWYSFLLQHGVKPFQSAVYDGKINGMILVNEKSGLKYKSHGKPVYYSENETLHYYFDYNMKMYSDKIAKFVCRCEEKANGCVINRISGLFSSIYIDEIQDMAGYDLEIIKYLMKSNSNIIMAGDPRQVTYHTHDEQKYKEYMNGKIEDFIINKCKGIDYIVDKTILCCSFRNNQFICTYSSFLYEDFPQVESKQKEITGHDGVFAVRPDDVEEYLKKYNPVQLRYNRKEIVNNGYDVMNMGNSKGLTFDRVMIYPTKAIKKWVIDHSNELEPKTKSLFYVSLTRARYSVAIVLDYNNETEIVGVEKYR